MKFFLLTSLVFSIIFADYKDTKSLYHDTSKSVHQSISLHNVKAEPAKVITTTEIRRVPRYEYYNVYKTRTVWKCLPNGGGGGTPPTAKFSWPAIYQIAVSRRSYKKYRWRIQQDNIFANSTTKITSPCGDTKHLSNQGGSAIMCGVRVKVVHHGGTTSRVYINAGSM